MKLLTLIGAALLAICTPAYPQQAQQDHSKDLERCASAWVEVAKSAGGHSLKDLVNLATFRELYEKLPQADRDTCVRVGKEQLGNIAAMVKDKSPGHATTEPAKPAQSETKQ